MLSFVGRHARAKKEAVIDKDMVRERGGFCIVVSSLPRNCGVAVAL
jgi:hypothetical protein